MKHVAIILVICMLPAGVARGDVFVLQSGGEVHGTLLNADESPRKTFVIKTAAGGQVSLAADEVKKVTRQSAAEAKYDQIRANYADTVDEQWKLAEWCRENKLLKQRREHLARIVELEPNHAKARAGLGYHQVEGRWVTQETLMTENGYVRYRGAWVLPQEVEIKEQERKQKKAQAEWVGKLRRWHAWLDTDKSDEAIAQIKAIDDPAAAEALARQLNNARDVAPQNVRLLYVATLGRLKDSAGMDALVSASLFDADDEVRMASLEEVAAHRYQPAVNKYVQALRNKDNQIINRAAACLAKMKDPAAVRPLIDALVTTHTYHVQKGQPGQTQATFGTGPGISGGGGFTFGGGGVEVVKETYQNRDALQALVVLTGLSFNYDQTAWKRWYAQQKKPTTLDVRRDEPAK